MDYYKSLITKYRYKIYSPFLNAIKDYDLISENDKIMVCISGGKDSFVMAVCFIQLMKHNDIPVELKFVVMNPGYSNEQIDEIKRNAEILNIPITVFNTDIFEISAKDEDKRCYLCAKMRRGALYNYAESLGYNKIALGHHFNDVNETLLLSILYSGEVAGMRPMVESLNHKGMKLIRPMYYVKEDDIINFEKDNNLKFLKSGCFITGNNSLCQQSKRQVVKKLIKELDGDKEYVSKNIFNSNDNVNLSKLNSYKIDGVKHNLIKKNNRED